MEQIKLMSGGADKKADLKRSAIQTAKDGLKITGTTYYISPCGDDHNDGKSPAAAKRTLESDVFTGDILKPGDAVLFERGGVWRAKAPIKCKSGIKYGAWGDGKKPAIYGSVQNYAQENLWTEISPHAKRPNLWVMPLLQTDAGIVVFNDGEYTGIKKFKHNELEKNGDFFHDTLNATLYLFCDKGNPGKVFRSIEIGVKYELFSLRSVDNVQIDNLCMKYTGTFAARAAETRNISITNCEMGWIGGSVLSIKEDGTPLRFGNAVEFWDLAENIRVEDNWIYQVYDTGLTFQSSDGWASHHEYRNVSFDRNLIEYCTWSIEFFCNDDGTLHNISFSDNIMRFSGYGWGKQRPNDGWDAHINCWIHTYRNVRSFNIKDNIFDCAAINMVAWVWNELSPGFHIENNMFYQKANDSGRIMRYKTREYSYASNQAELEAAIKEFDASPALVRWLDN